MAAPAKNTTAPKKERKKPVRTAPAQKDYPNKLAWLKAMTEHEEAEAAKATAAKVARLEKRLAAKHDELDSLEQAINDLERDLDVLKHGPIDGDVDVPGEPETVQPQG